MAKVDKEFISERFSELYMQKWQSQGKTQKEFAEAIKAVAPYSGMTASYVCKLLSGKYSPKRYLSAICDVLDVDINEFTPKGHDDRYQYASEFADGLEKALEDVAVKDFKIDLTFLRGLRNIIPDFDRLFPQFLPFFEYGPCDKTHKPYERYVPAKTVETSQGKGVLQIERDGKAYFLTIYDLKILRIIQQYVKRVVEYQFKEIKAEYKRAEAEVDLRYQELLLQENPDYPQDKVIWTTVHLSPEKLQEIDKYGMYTDKELSKYHQAKGKPIFREQDNTKTE